MVNHKQTQQMKKEEQFVNAKSLIAIERIIRGSWTLEQEASASLTMALGENLVKVAEQVRAELHGKE